MAGNSNKKLFRTQLVRTETYLFLTWILSPPSLDRALDGCNQVVAKQNVKRKIHSFYSFQSINNVKPTKSKAFMMLQSWLCNCCNLIGATNIPAAPNFNVQRFPRPYFFRGGQHETRSIHKHALAPLTMVKIQDLARSRWNSASSQSQHSCKALIVLLVFSLIIHWNSQLIVTVHESIFKQ